MDYKSEIKKITRAQFFHAIVQMKADNWRLVQICAVSLDHGYEMSYSFCGGRDYRMVTLRLEVGRTRRSRALPRSIHALPCRKMKRQSCSV